MIAEEWTRLRNEMVLRMKSEQLRAKFKEQRPEAEFKQPASPGRKHEDQPVRKQNLGMFEDPPAYDPRKNSQRKVGLVRSSMRAKPSGDNNASHRVEISD